jgi:hypothetical protein
MKLFWNAGASRPRAGVMAAAASALLLAAATSGCGGGSENDFGAGDTRLVTGATQTVDGAPVSTWARLTRDNDTVVEVGVTMPLSLAQNLPEAGSGPAGAVAVLDFPDAVKSSTFFNHFELNAEPEGHPPAQYGAAHFDLHFYAVPEAAVRQVAPPDPVAPAADRVPAGYAYPGPQATVPEMGVHALPIAELAPGAPPFTASMIVGFYNGEMTFLEPMVTQEKLLQKQSFTLDVPRPAVLGRSTRYPTRFAAIFDAQANAYHFVFTEFVSVAQ